MKKKLLQWIEERLHAWFLENQEKVNPNFWWDINNEFLDEALEGIGIRTDEYAAFYAHKREEHGLLVTSE